MIDLELLDLVRQLRSEGRSPKEIARALGVSPAMVTPMIRRIAKEGTVTATALTRRRCWISPGWCIGLRVERSKQWPGSEDAGPGDGERPPGQGGIVGVLVVQDDRYGKVSVCGYLVDTWCLGVKNALGPRIMSEKKLQLFRETFFAPFDSAPIDAPVELAQHVVWGAVDYARELGFEPHEDLWSAAGHLERLQGPAAITFGKDGRPFYIQGPYDDSSRNLRTLEHSVGRGNFSFEVSVFDSFRNSA
jgi:hypothetical protein